MRLRDGHFLADGDAGRGLPLAEVAAAPSREGGPVEAYVSYTPETRDETTSFCAQVAAVEVDPETGQVSVRRIVSANDIGTVLNPLSLHGQIEGRVAMGLGYALMEELRVEDGQVLTAHFGDYKIPTIQNIPLLTTVLLDEPTGPTPYEGKGIGETPLSDRIGHRQRRGGRRGRAHHRPADHGEEGAAGDAGQRAGPVDVQRLCPPKWSGKMSI